MRVLGTRFLLDESRNDTAFVHVEAGKVQYTAVGQPDAVILTRGMRAQVVKGQQKPQVLTQRAQTRKGSFVFSNTPLQKVLDELSRYYNVRLTADNTDKRLTANFNSRSLDEIIEIIEKVLKVKLKRRSDENIFLCCSAVSACGGECFVRIHRDEKSDRYHAGGISCKFCIRFCFG